MGSTSPTANAKILNTASLLMMHLIAAWGPFSRQNARGAILFLRALPQLTQASASPLDPD